uniref:Uncharacterized protein n=1 Tax=Cannabis sativa TaxID=3483 RepID=A0A803PE09_CANSA
MTTQPNNKIMTAISLEALAMADHHDDSVRVMDFEEWERTKELEPPPPHLLLADEDEEGHYYNDNNHRQVVNKKIILRSELFLCMERLLNSWCNKMLVDLSEK